MKILSHRGLWVSPSEKNTAIAFERSFGLGFGTETDLRDYRGELVISHDMPAGDEMYFSELLALLHQFDADPITLALNIKADGLATQVGNSLAAMPALDAFVFDMSVPDMRSYLNAGIPFFTRVSDVERHPVWLQSASGVWLDSFESDWYDVRTIEEFLDQGKRVCIVSPELHHRSQETAWQTLKPLFKEANLLLCTDFPEKARDYFSHDQNETSE